ncbi:hypothetical protein COTS27_00533 [Spirochaetota bacterium]|nr:hypothetical protein COTS27_00533 [Spirochaetota bacterium]
MNSIFNTLARMNQIRGRFDKYFANQSQRPPSHTTALTTPQTSALTPTTLPTASSSPIASIDQVNQYATHTQLATTLRSLPSYSNNGLLSNSSASALSTAGDPLALGAFKDLLAASLKRRQPSQSIQNTIPTLPLEPTVTGTGQINDLKSKLLGPLARTERSTSVEQQSNTITGSELKRKRRHDDFPYRSEITAAANRYKLPVALVRSVVQAESNFNPLAVSHKGAMGLMQLMPQTVTLLGVSDPYDVTENLMGGTRYLRSLLDQYGGDYAKALAAYNAGETAVERAIEKTGAGVPPYNETNEYIKKILTSYMKYSGVQS